jgi:hypothetical protein
MEHPKDENFLGVFFMRDVLCHKCCGIMRDEEGEFGVSSFDSVV